MICVNVIILLQLDSYLKIACDELKNGVPKVVKREEKIRFAYGKVT